ncbi:hypothetical protein LZ31DRAFT_83708 [Colletotrichum somersetense]|nr:hypothetical protein LZ31DRAFT_83708 [Colletotrichum somersetense]
MSSSDVGTRSYENCWPRPANQDGRTGLITLGFKSTRGSRLPVRYTQMFAAVWQPPIPTPPSRNMHQRSPESLPPGNDAGASTASVLRESLRFRWFDPPPLFPTGFRVLSQAVGQNTLPAISSPGQASDVSPGGSRAKKAAPQCSRWPHTLRLGFRRCRPGSGLLSIDGMAPFLQRGCCPKKRPISISLCFIFLSSTDSST